MIEVTIQEIKTYVNEFSNNSSVTSFTLHESKSIKLSNGGVVKIPTARTIHSGSWLGYTEYGHREYEDDLGWVFDKEVTVKIMVTVPKRPNYIPKIIWCVMVQYLTEVKLIPYWSCDCWRGRPITSLVYTKEKFEEALKCRKKYVFQKAKDISKSEELTTIKPFCALHGYCASEIAGEYGVTTDAKVWRGTYRRIIERAEQMGMQPEEDYSDEYKRHQKQMLIDLYGVDWMKRCYGLDESKWVEQCSSNPEGHRGMRYDRP